MATTDSNVLKIQRPSSSTTKQDEKGIAIALRDFFAGTQSFMEDLFTKELTEWVCQQITDDAPPDVYKWWCDEIKSDAAAREHLQNMVKEWQQATKDARAERDSARANLLEVNNALRMEREDDLTVRTNLRRELNELGIALTKCQEFALDARTTIEKQNLEIMRLKAMLWDVEHSAAE